MLPKECGSGSVCHKRFQELNKLDVFKKTWVKLLKVYDEKIVDINWTWQSFDSISIKSPLGGEDKTRNYPTDMSKLGTKRHILTNKKGIPLSIAISPAASTHNVNLVIEIVDNTVIKRPKSLFRSKSKSRRRKEKEKMVKK